MELQSRAGSGSRHTSIPLAPPHLCPPAPFLARRRLSGCFLSCREEDRGDNGADNHPQLSSSTASAALFSVLADPLGARDH